jgi:hypothetical protein
MPIAAVDGWQRRAPLWFAAEDHEAARRDGRFVARVAQACALPAESEGSAHLDGSIPRDASAGPPQVV